MSRELFVDGYDAAGNRIYDKVNGLTCHQCRQKTLGKRTSCSGCGSLQVTPEGCQSCSASSSHAWHSA
jgi:predicted amidophosphoribosyltransferase